MRWTFLLAIALAGCLAEPAAILVEPAPPILASDDCTVLVGFEPISMAHAQEMVGEAPLAFNVTGGLPHNAWQDAAAAVLLHIACPSSQHAQDDVGISFYGLAMASGTDLDVGSLRMAWFGGAANDDRVLRYMASTSDDVAKRTLDWYRAAGPDGGQRLGIALHDVDAAGYNIYADAPRAAQDPASHGGLTIQLESNSATWRLIAPGETFGLDGGFVTFSKGTAMSQALGPSQRCMQPSDEAPRDTILGGCHGVPNPVIAIGSTGKLELRQ